MKKLLAVTTMVLLLCSLLSTSLFAYVSGPSIIGPTGFASAGYLLYGEIADYDAEVEYDTNLPLGEITAKIKPAPSPSGKTKVVVEVVEVVEIDVVEIDETHGGDVNVDLVEVEIDEIDITDINLIDIGVEVIGDEESYDYVILIDGVVMTGFNLDELFANYSLEEANIVSTTEWTTLEEDGALELGFGELFIVVTEDGYANIIYNSAEEALDMEVMAGVPFITYEMTADLTDIEIMQIAIDAYVAISSYVAEMEFDGDLIFTLTIVLPDDLGNIEINIVPASSLE